MKNYKLTYPDKTEVFLSKKEFEDLRKSLDIPRLNYILRLFAHINEGVDLKSRAGLRYRLKIHTTLRRFFYPN